jgi:hypothetical protein
MAPTALARTSRAEVPGMSPSAHSTAQVGCMMRASSLMDTWGEAGSGGEGGGWVA